MEKPIVLVIMDGVGKGDGGSGDAVAVAKTPTLDHLLATCPHTYLKAHGTAVGLPTDDDMGNSEVGHNALGCGQIYSQGAKLVGESIENGTLYASETWKDLIATPFPARRCISWVCCPTATSIPTSITSLLCCGKPMPRA